MCQKLHLLLLLILPSGRDPKGFSEKQDAEASLVLRGQEDNPVRETDFALWQQPNPCFSLTLKLIHEGQMKFLWSRKCKREFLIKCSAIGHHNSEA